MKRQTWTDMYGRKHVVHTVRSPGRGWGFGVYDIARHQFVHGSGMTRAEAWEYLRAYEAKHPGAS